MDDFGGRPEDIIAYIRQRQRNTAPLIKEARRQFAAEKAKLVERARRGEVVIADTAINNE